MSLRPGEIITIPSPIDVHTHLREPGGEEKETIESGTAAALAGGYQAIFDMPNNPAPYQTWTEVRLDEKEQIARRSAHTDIGLYLGVNLEDPNFDELPWLVPRVAGVKLYQGFTTGNAKAYGLDDVREYVDAFMTEGKKSGQRPPPVLLHAEGEVGFETASYVAAQEYPVHWCHISDEEEVGHARQLSQRYPFLFTAGVTPHHLTMTDRNADFQQGWNARMMPPLGTEVDAEMLLDAFNKGWIQILETDHAPHATQEKLRAEDVNPLGHIDAGDVTCFGVSGIEFVLPVMMGLVQRQKVSLERLVMSLYYAPARMLGLRGAFQAARSNLTELEIGAHVIGENDIVGKSRNTPYIGWMGGATVRAVTRNGRLVGDALLTEERFEPRILRTGSEVASKQVKR